MFGKTLRILIFAFVGIVGTLFVVRAAQASEPLSFEEYKAQRKALSYDEFVKKSEDQLYRNDTYHFRIKFPAGWEMKDGDGQHVVKKAVKDGSTVLVLVNNDFFDTLLSTEERKSLSDRDIQSIELNSFSDEEINAFLETLVAGQLESFPGSTIIEKGIRYVDNRKAAYFKMNQVYKAQGIQTEGISVNYFTIHKGRLYQIGGFYSKGESDKESTINTSLSTFVFEDWDDASTNVDTAATGKLSDSTNEALNLFSGDLSGFDVFLAIGISIFFTWVLGLAIPLLLRFVFLKRPLSKGLSLLVVSVIFIIQALASVAIANDGKSRISMSLYLVAYIGYLTLRKGLKDSGVRYCKVCGSPMEALTTTCNKCNAIIG